MPFSGSFAPRSSPDTLVLSLVRGPLLSQSRYQEESASITPGCIVQPVYPDSPEVSQGSIWFSRVPRLPLCIHDLVSDSGGVPLTRHLVNRTAAFRCFKYVGFLPILRHYPNVHNCTYFGALYRPCILDSLSFVLPLPVLHVRFTIALLA